MSEIKEGKTVVNVDFIRMLETQNRGQAETIGALKENISNLKEQNENDKKVVTIINKNKRNPVFYGAGYDEVQISKVNLEDAASLIAEKVNENNEVELKELKSSLKSKERELLEFNESTKDRKAETLRRTERAEADYIERTYQHKQEYAKSNTDLKHKVQDLKDEIVKIKSDKTDEQLEKTRRQEVTKLKNRITTLEREVNRLLSMSWISRTWDRIINRNALIEANKQVLAEKREANDIHAQGGIFNWIRLG